MTDVSLTEGEGRIDVTADGEPFAGYVHRTDLPVLRKPVLHPIHTAEGTTITRGYPLDPRPGERCGQPHHAGAWLTYYPVNGVNFWNTTGEIPADEETEWGVIRHDETERAAGGEGIGHLDVTADWTRADGLDMLREETAYTFRADGDRRAIDRVTTLTNVMDEPASMPDDKEGLFAVRVARELEHPETVYIDTNPDELIGEDGEPVPADRAPDLEPNGEYRSSEGVRGIDVWGTRAKWMSLTGDVEGDTVTVSIMDHPDNVGHPTRWHARAYGLFSANPLGPSVFDDDAEPLDLELAPDESITLRFRLAVDDGEPTSDELDERFERFADEVR